MQIVRVRPGLFEGRIQPFDVLLVFARSERKQERKKEIKVKAIFTGCDSLIWFGNVLAGHRCLLWQPDRVADEHGRLHERCPGKHGVWRSGKLPATNPLSWKSYLCILRWWQQWMWPLRRRTGVALRLWVFSLPFVEVTLPVGMSCDEWLIRSVW